MKFTNDSTIAKYSENPEVLAETLKDVTIGIERVPLHDFLDHMVYRIEVTRNGKVIKFIFHDSIDNCDKRKKPGWYSILCCIGSNGLMDVSSFENFCSEFGYNPDLIKDNALYEKCKEQYTKIHTLFTDEELENFPR